MIDNGLKNSPAYRVAYSMYVALGGDPMTDFDSVEAIYDEVDVLFGKGNNRITVETIAMEIVENGDYNFDDEEVTGYKPVNIKVDVPQKYTDEQVENIRVEAETTGYNNGYGVGMNDGYNNGYGVGYAEGDIAGQQTGYNTGYAEGFTQGETEGYNDGYAEGLDDGAEDQKALLEDITIKENGVYEKEDGYKKVKVEIEGVGPTKSKIYNGFQFTGGDIAKVDFSQYDWSNVYDTSYFFENCSHSTGDWSNFLENYNGKILSGYFMFNNCKTLTSIPQLDTSNVGNMSYMFNKCSALTSIPQLDTSNVGNMSYMFNKCSALTSIPQLDTSNVTNMISMFDGCSALTSISQLDTSNVTNMISMFDGCSALTSISQLDTSNVTNMLDMFDGCKKLTSIPQLDCSSVEYFGIMGYYGSTSYNNTLKNLGGFINLGKQKNLTLSEGVYYGLEKCGALTYNSIMNVINNLYDRASAGHSILTFKLHANALALLNEEDIAIATNKGWTIA